MGETRRRRGRARHRLVFPCGDEGESSPRLSVWERGRGSPRLSVRGRERSLVFSHRDVATPPSPVGRRGKKREKKKREKNTWSPLRPHDLSPSRSVTHGRFLLPVRGEEKSPHVGRRKVSPRGEKERDE
ncbi:hypothetical protein BHM03_00060425, partial [Ensete ventricosum]